MKNALLAILVAGFASFTVHQARDARVLACDFTAAPGSWPMVCQGAIEHGAAEQRLLVVEGRGLYSEPARIVAE